MSDSVIIVKVPFCHKSIRPVKAYRVTRKCGHREYVVGRGASEKELWRLVHTPCAECVEEIRGD